MPKVGVFQKIEISGKPPGAVKLFGGFIMEHRLKFREKLAFGLGDFGGNFCFSFLTSFAMIYFTDIAGSNVAAIAFLLMIAKCFDGITDLIMGHLLDHTHSKMGKARPWLFWSAFPLALTLVLLFNVPSALPPAGKNIYIFVVYILVCAFFYTASNISYNALTSLITDNADDRVSMGSIRFMCTAAAGIIIGSFTTVLIDAFGTGQKGWTGVSILYAVIFLIATMITVFGVKELRTVKDAEQNADPGGNGVPFIKSVVLLLKNKYFILTFLVFLVLYVFTGASGASGIYYATYVLGNANLFGLLSIAMMIPMFLALIFAPKVTEKLGLQKTCIMGSLFFIGGSLVVLLSRDTMPVLIAGIAIRSLGMAPISAAIFAFIAEAAQYAKLKDSVSIEGMVYSCSSIGIKVGSGLGVAIVGWMMNFGHYDGTLAVQGESALGMIAASYKVLPLAVGILILFLFLPMNVERVNKELSKRI
jgi:GPH family glycoside/pentoside/hexuronide:cation symporter